MACLRIRTSSNFITRFLNSAIPQSFSTIRRVETLAYEEIESSTTTSTAFILHGLLGSARNWRSFSRSLSASIPELRIVMVDLRNHGKSAEIEGIKPPHNLMNAAKDLAELVKGKGWKFPDVVVGHSMGGKVALQYAQSCARGDYGDSVSTPKQLWVLDSVPGEVSSENSDGEVEKVLETLQSLPSVLPSRRWLVNHMIELGFSKSLSEWIGSNLKKSEDGETWAFNLAGAVEMFNSYRETSYWSLLENPPTGMEIGIVVAEKSDRWESDVIYQLESLSNKPRGESEGKVSLHILPNSGHWVHVDNPKGLLEILTPKIATIASETEV